MKGSRSQSAAKSPRRIVTHLEHALAGEEVELADETPRGGTMRGLTVPGGAEVYVSWHQPREAPETTWVRVRHPDGWSDPLPLPASARVACVLRTRDAGDSAAPDEVVDPLQRHVHEMPLWTEATP